MSASHNALGNRCKILISGAGSGEVGTCLAGTGAGVAEEEGTSGEAEVAKGKGLARFGVDWELLSWLLV